MTSSTDSALHLGSELADRYRLVRRIAAGGMGEVWEATDLVLDRTVAVKILHDTEVRDPRDLERFRAEARHAAALTHPGVARVYDYGEVHADAPVGYLVMELVDGEPLSAWIARRATITPQQVVSVLIQAADALAAAHDAGLVHRDVKPGNMMITTAGRLKLTDFGIAGASGAPCTDNGEVVGTARYMSPEQATGGVPSPRSDVYSLAVVGYELLAGHPPFDGLPAAVALAHVRNAPAKLPGDVPSGLADLIHRALAKDPSRRPADGHDFAAALRRLPDVNTATGVIAPVAPGTGAGHRAVALDATERQPTIRRAAPAPTTPMAAAPPALVGLREIAARPRRRRIVTLIAAASVAVLVIAAIVAGLRRSPDLQDLASTRETTAPTTAPPAPTVTVTAEALVGRPLSEVRETLQSEGLQVTVTPESGAADPTAVVVDVSPTGPIAVGATVLVTVEAAPPSTTASPATAPPAPPAKPAPAGGKGHGKGKGKG